ncbi:MAG: response regulator, partial [Ruminococcus sp.]|nr:response regulator [Ruminococcus sp.]
MNILICDDEKEAAETVRSMILKKYGSEHFVTTFCSADEVNDYVSEDGVSVDVAIMDIELSGSNGMKLSLLLKNIYPELEIIHFTGYADKYDEDIF